MSVKVYWASKKEDVFEQVYIQTALSEFPEKILDGTVYIGSNSITVHTNWASTLYPYSKIEKVDFFRACQANER